MLKMFRRKKLGEVGLDCPRCHVVMRKLKKKGVVIDVCPECNGLWLDDKEIDKMFKVAKKESGKSGKKK